MLKLPFPDSRFKPRVEGLLRKSNILRSLSALEEAYQAKFPRRIREAEALTPGHRAPEEQWEDLRHSAAKGESKGACLFLGEAEWSYLEQCGSEKGQIQVCRKIVKAQGGRALGTWGPGTEEDIFCDESTQKEEFWREP